MLNDDCEVWKEAKEERREFLSFAIRMSSEWDSLLTSNYRRLWTTVCELWMNYIDFDFEKCQKNARRVEKKLEKRNENFFGRKIFEKKSCCCCCCYRRTRVSDFPTLDENKWLFLACRCHFHVVVMMEIFFFSLLLKMMMKNETETSLSVSRSE